MRIRKLIKEELSDLSWIKNSKATLKDKIIEFEPMLNFEEWNQVLDLLMSHVVTFDEDIIWWSDRLLDDFQPLEEGQYLHHLLISKDGRMVCGGMDLDIVYTLRDDGFSEDEIANDYENHYESIDLFLDDHPGKFDSPETIDGRKYFNIPYKKPIQESEDFDFINDSPELHGVTFKAVGSNQIYQINDIGFRSYVDITWIGPDGSKKESAYKRDIVNKYFRDGSWVIYDEPYSDSINESEEMGWITDTELPILPYIGKRFKLILDGGKDSGRRYKIIDYYYEGKYNKNYYVNSVLLDPETLKETQKRFNSPMDRAMELIKDGDWVFIDKI